VDAAPPFLALLRKLKKFYGRPSPPRLKGALEMILWENCAYLADDDRRAAAFALLKKRVGLKPKHILDADPRLLVEVGRFGIVPYESAKKLHLAAEVAHYAFKDDVDSVLDKPLKEAKKQLQRFPSIGEPGAEKILLFTRRQKILALDSNGLRALLRYGFGEEKKSYAASYRSAQAATASQLPDSIDDLIAAHLLLRRHGQEICRRNDPACSTCPVAPDCRYAQTLRR
jgi:endonuclease III